jgi:hypothetical protein
MCSPSHRSSGYALLDGAEVSAPEPRLSAGLACWLLTRAVTERTLGNRGLLLATQGGYDCGPVRAMRCGLDRMASRPSRRPTHCLALRRGLAVGYAWSLAVLAVAAGTFRVSSAA